MLAGADQLTNESQRLWLWLFQEYRRKRPQPISQLPPLLQLLVGSRPDSESPMICRARWIARGRPFVRLVSVQGAWLASARVTLLEVHAQ